MTTVVSSHVSWKGKTFYQITSSLRLNAVDTTAPTPFVEFLRATPVRGYRRELASTSTSSTTSIGCHERTQPRRLDEIQAPGGYLITTSAETAKSSGGLIGTLEPELSNNTSNTPNPCFPENCGSTSTQVDNVCFRPDLNALRRCRSAGMNRKKIIAENGNDQSYFSNNAQYLHSRNRQFSQNQYSYIRQGSATAQPGSSQSLQNVYSASGLSHCPKYKIAANLGNTQMSYIWVDGTTYNVTISEGAYDIYDLDAVLTQQLVLNTHYYINPTTGAKNTLLHLGYDLASGTITITAQSRLDIPTYTAGGTWSATRACPQFVLPSSLQVAFGFVSAGTYPTTFTATSTAYGTIKTSVLAPPYVPVYYKPSNYQFSEQGGVSSSSRTLRLKYNNIMTAAGRTAPYNMALANAMAYDVPVPDYPNTVKDKIGYPETATPIVKEFGDNSNLNRCKKFIYRRG